MRNDRPAQRSNRTSEPPTKGTTMNLKRTLISLTLIALVGSSALAQPEDLVPYRSALTTPMAVHGDAFSNLQAEDLIPEAIVWKPAPAATSFASFQPEELVPYSSTLAAPMIVRTTPMRVPGSNSITLQAEDLSPEAIVWSAPTTIFASYGQPEEVVPYRASTPSLVPGSSLTNVRAEDLAPDAIVWNAPQHTHPTLLAYGQPPELVPYRSTQVVPMPIENPTLLIAHADELAPERIVQGSPQRGPITYSSYGQPPELVPYNAARDGGYVAGP